MEILSPKYSLFITLFFAVFSSINSYEVSKTPYKHQKVLDEYGSYTLEWEYFPEKEIIIFHVSAVCEGYVGFGLSKSGNMTKSDFLVAGVYPDGSPYSLDMHSKDSRVVIQDKKQDWTLLSAAEERGVTKLSFSRPLSTCDEEDLEIIEGRTVVLWAYGENDVLDYHHQNRGVKELYLLDPNYTPRFYPDSISNPLYVTNDRSDTLVWSLRRTSFLDGKQTSYICSIHRGMQLPNKHHIIGYKTYLESEEARKHSHHLVVYKCRAPNGVNPVAIFEHFVDHPGEECHFSENRRLPINFCRQMIYVWGVGGEPLFLNTDVGINVDSSDEYLMFETHFDNRDERKGVKFDIGVDFFLTPELRPRDGSMLTIGYAVDGSNQIFPPASIDFHVIGQCDSKCTEDMFPKQGVRISEVFLHAHQSAKELYLRHFRNNKELSPVLTDENFNPFYQQYRNLRNPVTVLPGDHLVMECVIDNRNANGTTVGGFGTLRQEMCVAFMTVDVEIDRTLCLSEFPANQMLYQLGVGNVTWDADRQVRIATSPESLAGLTLAEVSDYHVNWTSNKARLLEFDMMYSAHAVWCPDFSIPNLEVFMRKSEKPDKLNAGPESKNGSSVSHVYAPNKSNKYIQQLVKSASHRQLLKGSVSLLTENDIGALVMQASAYPNPVLLTATGLTGIGAPATAKFPVNATKYQPKNNSPENCMKRIDKTAHYFSS